ncbi:MAG: glycosyltransferase family 1 protein [Candidatus Promineifilaceae bacterium]
MVETVGVDATPLLGERSGVGNYTARLLAAQLEREPEREYLLYSNRPLENLEPGLERAKEIQGYLPQSRWLWLQVVLPRIIRKTRPDICHFTNALAPLWLNTPYVLSIYDATLFLYSRYHPRSRLLAIRLMLPLAARRASAVITISESARKDLLRILKIPSEKIHVVYGAAPKHFARVTNTAEQARIRQKYSLPDEYLLYVGTLEPRKNLSRLVRAFHRLKKQGKPHKLVLVGPWGWSMNGFRQQIEQLGLTDSVQMLGYIPDEDLPGVYSLATVFAFPSLYEGFGLPPLEAMACGTPVLSSKNSSLAEICGDAAYLVDPLDEESLVEGLQCVLEDKALREKLGECGQQRASEFSWERAARETSAVYDLVLKNSLPNLAQEH